MDPDTVETSFGPVRLIGPNFEDIGRTAPHRDGRAGRDLPWAPWFTPRNTEMLGAALEQLLMEMAVSGQDAAGLVQLRDGLHTGVVPPLNDPSVKAALLEAVQLAATHRERLVLPEVWAMTPAREHDGDFAQLKAHLPDA